MKVSTSIASIDRSYQSPRSVVSVASIDRISRLDRSIGYRSIQSSRSVNRLWIDRSVAGAFVIDQFSAAPKSIIPFSIPD